MKRLQHGFVHGGVIGMIADTAVRYVAMTVALEIASLIDALSETLTIKWSQQLPEPACRR